MGYIDNPRQPSGQQPISDGQLQERMYNDSYSRPVADQSAEQLKAGADPQALMQTAQTDLTKKGMTADVKSEFNAALKAADKLWTHQDVEVTAALLQALKTGQKPDGTPLTAADRMQAHQLVNEEFAAATLGMQYRMVYGNFLNQNKQFASAEQVFKDDITVADKLPIASFKQELNQLATDAQNPNLSQADQAQLVQYMQIIQGSGTSKDDGLMYLPITARKQAAIFYISGDLPGPNGEAPVGIVKPQQAMQMIDDAAAKEKQLYGVDPNHDTSWDPTLTNLAQSLSPMLPENIRKEKEQTEKMWSSPLVDAGTAAGALYLASIVGSFITKNPDGLEWALKADTTSANGYGLSLAGKTALGGVTIGAATVGRHSLEPLLSGSNESWGTSAIHSTAAVGAAWALLGTRSAGSPIFFKAGSNSTSDAIERVADERGTVAAGSNMTAGELNTALGDKAPKALKSLAESSSDQALITNGELTSATLPGMTEAETKAILKLAKSQSSSDLTAQQLIDFMTSKGRNYVIPDAVKGLNPDTFVVSNGQLTSEGEEMANGMNFTSAQATTLAHDAAAVQRSKLVTRQFSKLAPSNLVASFKGINPASTLDLTSASAQQMAMRRFYSGYTGSLAGLSSTTQSPLWTAAPSPMRALVSVCCPTISRQRKITY